MVTLTAVVAILFMCISGINSEKEASEKGNDWHATAAKEDVLSFIKNSKTYNDTKASEDSASVSNEFHIDKWHKTLDDKGQELNRKHDSNRNFVSEKNKREHKSQKRGKHKHAHTHEETKINEKRHKKYGKDRSHSAEKGKHQNKNTNSSKEKVHNEESNKEKFNIKEKEKSRNRDIERNTKPTRNPAIMQEVFKLNENNTSPSTDRSKDIDANKKIPHKENNKSEVHDKHSKVDGLKNIAILNKLHTESVPIKWPTPKLRAGSKLRKHKKKDGLRSTRMPPVALNQLDEVPEPPKQKPLRPNDPTPPDTLSPYAIMAQMKIVMDCFPHANATFETIGRTVEYNDIILVKISERKKQFFRASQESKYIDELPEKKILFIVHGLSVMGMKLLPISMVGTLKILMSYYLNHLDKFDIYLMPLANPDGYNLHINSGSMWNKNASPQDACRGVYLDRNFDVAWNGTPQISSCSQLYPGSAPFSEVETNAVRNIFRNYNNKIIAYIHVHSGTYDSKAFKGDAILYPRGYTDEEQSDDDRYIDLKLEVDECLKNASFQVMSVTVDTLHSWYGKISGSSVDYASTVYGIPFALEFVMQLYELDLMQLTPENPIHIGYIALTEIWSRLINTVFTSIWKAQQEELEDKRKK